MSSARKSLNRQIDLNSLMRSQRSVTLPCDLSLNNIFYRPATKNTPVKNETVLEVIGYDTEAYTDGKCFMHSTSEGDVFGPDDFPEFLFSNKYRDKTFVTFNLRYDAGALLQNLPSDKLEELRQTRKTEFEGYTYRVFANKELSIRMGKHRIVFYDMLSFYNCSLRKAAETYLDIRKLESDTNSYTRTYVNKNWDEIARYCIRDSEIVKELGNIIIKTFDGFGIRPKKLISTAYVSWQYFRSKTKPQLVLNLYNYSKPVLQAAINSYNGGKFEITQRGPGMFYEYDIVSAYPYEIARLRPFDDRKPRSGIIRDVEGSYIFADVSLSIPLDASSPIVFSKNGTCVFPSARFRRWLTGDELFYAEKRGWVDEIHNSFTLLPSSDKPLYKPYIDELMGFKGLYKEKGDKMRYQAVKILLNSLYGKFAQLIEDQGKIQAGTSWNPVFASYITARTRIRIAEMQERFPEVVAVHTDSLISTKKLDIDTSSDLGGWEYQQEGKGVVFACGIYQIGQKSRFRGFSTKKPLLEMMPESGPIWEVKDLAPYSWREVAFRHMPLDMINRFSERVKHVKVVGDNKRIWIDDYEDYSEVRKRVVMSQPIPAFWLG